MLRLELQKRFEHIDDGCRTPILTISARSMSQGTSSDSETTTKSFACLHLRMLCACGSKVNPITRRKEELDMNSIIYVVGLVVVVLFVAGFFGA